MVGFGEKETDSVPCQTPAEESESCYGNITSFIFLPPSPLMADAVPISDIHSFTSTLKLLPYHKIIKWEMGQECHYWVISCVLLPSATGATCVIVCGSGAHCSMARNERKEKKSWKSKSDETFCRYADFFKPRHLMLLLFWLNFWSTKWFYKSWDLNTVQEKTCTSFMMKSLLCDMIEGVWMKNLWF